MRTLLGREWVCIAMTACVGVIQSAPAQVQTAESVHSESVHQEGRAVVGENETYQEACQRALRMAQEQAVARIVGVEVHGATGVSMRSEGTQLARLVQVYSTGQIVSQKDPVWRVDWQPREGGRLPEITVIAALDMVVAPEKGEPDPSFRVRLQLNQEGFTDGDRMVVTVESSKPGFLRVFNETADNRVTQIFPYARGQDNAILANHPISIGVAEDPFDLKVHPLEGQRSSQEAIIAVVTKADVPFWETPQKGTPGRLGGGESRLVSTAATAMVEFYRWMNSMQPDQRAIAEAIYTVIQK